MEYGFILVSQICPGLDLLLPKLLSRDVFGVLRESDFQKSHYVETGFCVSTMASWTTYGLLGKLASKSQKLV